MFQVTTQEFPETPEVEATNEELILPEATPTTSRNSDSVASTSTLPEVSLSKPRKKPRTGPANYDKLSNEMLQDAYAILKKTSTTPIDHYESFGNHITSELRKYDSQTLPYVKRAILDVLFQADIGGFTPHTGSEYHSSSVSSTPVPLASPQTVVSPVSAVSYTELRSPSYPTQKPENFQDLENFRNPPSLPQYFSGVNPELMQ